MTCACDNIEGEEKNKNDKNNVHQTPAHVGGTAEAKDMEAGSTTGMFGCWEIARGTKVCSLSLFWREDWHRR